MRGGPALHGISTETEEVKPDSGHRVRPAVCQWWYLSLLTGEKAVSAMSEKGRERQQEEVWFPS